MGSKRDEIGIESNGSIQMESVCPMLGVSLTITTSPQHFSREASSGYGLTNVSSFHQPGESSSIELVSSQEISPICNPVCRAKGRGKASKVMPLTLVSIGVLEKDEVTIGKEVKWGSDTSSRSVKCVSPTTLDYRGREDSQSS